MVLEQCVSKKHMDHLVWLITMVDTICRPTQMLLLKFSAQLNSTAEWRTLLRLYVNDHPVLIVGQMILVIMKMEVQILLILDFQVPTTQHNLISILFCQFISILGV